MVAGFNEAGFRVKAFMFERDSERVLLFESIARFSLKSQSSDQGFQNLSVREQIEL